jgi:hypothetical protein
MVEGSTRVHAKRSCTLCRHRKTRCELPEASVLLPPSEDILSPNQACHRCRLLNLSCILSDVAKKSRPLKRARATSPTRPLLRHDTSSSSRISPVINSLDILSTFETDEDAANGAGTSKTSMTFHGRPLELTCAMLELAYEGDSRYELPQGIAFDPSFIDSLELG